MPTNKLRVILQLLSQHGEMSGLQLVERSEGALKRGTAYVHLNLAQEGGFVSSRPHPSRPGARLYRCTEQGRLALAASRDFAESVLQPA